MNERPHSELELLLPWYANGTLAEEERRGLERHLLACAACRDALESCRTLGSALTRGAPPVPAPHPAQLARLRARIARGELDREHEPERLVRRPSRVAGAWRTTPRPVRWLIAAQAAALLALGAWIGAPGPAPTRQFRTLAGAETAARRASLRVVFARGVGESEMRALLLEARAEIVGGPSPLGAYALSFHPGVVGESPEAVLSLLRADPRVRLAEPIPDAGDAPK